MRKEDDCNVFADEADTKKNPAPRNARTGLNERRKWYHEEFAPKDNYPINRGFQDCYGTIYGVVNYFDPFSLVNGDKPVREVPSNYYSTVALADTAVTYINRYAGGEQPFFMYLAIHRQQTR